MAAEQKTSTEVLQSERVILPTSIKANHYQIDLTPDLTEDGFTYTGVCVIHASVVEENVGSVTVNGYQLTVSKAIVKQGSTNIEVSSENINIDKDLQQISFNVEPALEKGDVTIEYQFEGSINDVMTGFYRSRYKTAEGETKYLGSTQFEACYARQAFPCFDEPCLKATFGISIVHKKELQALSCMPSIELSESDKTDGVPDGCIRTKFENTPVMSSYLLAWCIGEFEYIETYTKEEKTRVRCYTIPGRIKDAEFALNVGKESLEFYEEYFGIEYPLPKLDMIGIPDFNAGAMENWGLVTYRIDMFLCSNDSSTATKEITMTTVTHELAHMWFGNLVSPEWWSQLWLKEGFACYLQYLCGDAIKPEWNLWLRFIEEEFVYALRVDAIENSHPIEVEVRTPQEADEIFDGISYSKGASIIRMIVSYLGKEKVREGLNKYLSKYKYSNAVTEDLWDCLSTEEVNITEVMNSWTKCMGYPVISVTKTNSTTYELTQKHFFMTKEATEDTVWSIPLMIRCSGSEEIVRILMTEKTMTLTLPESNWVKLNNDYSGFYIVDYSIEMLNDLSNNIDFLSVLDRYSLIKDYSFLMRVSSSGSQALELMKGFGEETEYSVWDGISSGIGAISHILGHEDAKLRQCLNSYAQNLFIPLFDKLTWDAEESDSYERRLLRSMCVKRLASSEYQPVIEEGQKRFREHLEGKTTLDPDLRTSVYWIGSRHGDENDYELLLNHYKTTKTDDEKKRCLRSFGNFPQPELIKRSLDMSMDDELVRMQDMGYVIVGAGGNLHGIDIVWDYFIVPHWEEIFKKTDGGSVMNWIAHSIGSFIGNDKADEMEKFFSTASLGSTTRTVKQVVEKIRGNTAWKERDFDNLANWLRDAHGSSAGEN